MAIIVSVPTSRAGKYGEMAGDAMQTYVDARQKAEQLKRQQDRQDAQDQRAKEQHDYSMAQNRLTAATQEWTSGGMVDARPTLGQFLPGGAPAAPAAGSVSTQSYGGPDPLPGTQGPMAPEQAAWQAGQMGAAANIDLSKQRDRFGLTNTPGDDPSVRSMSTWANMLNSPDPDVQEAGRQRREVWARDLIPGLEDSITGLFEGLEDGSPIREWAENQHAAILGKDRSRLDGVGSYEDLLKAKLLLEVDLEDELRRETDVEKYITNNAEYQEYRQQVSDALKASVNADSRVLTGYDDYTGSPIYKIDSGKQRQIEEAQSKMRKILEMERDARGIGGASPSEVANSIMATSMDTRSLISELESRGLSAGVPGADPTAFSPGGGGGRPITPGTVVPVGGQGGQGTPIASPPPPTPGPEEIFLTEDQVIEMGQLREVAEDVGFLGIRGIRSGDRKVKKAAEDSIAKYWEIIDGGGSEAAAMQAAQYEVLRHGYTPESLMENDEYKGMITEKGPGAVRSQYNAPRGSMLGGGLVQEIDNAMERRLGDTPGGVGRLRRREITQWLESEEGSQAAFDSLGLFNESTGRDLFDLDDVGYATDEAIDLFLDAKDAGIPLPVFANSQAERSRAKEYGYAVVPPSVMKGSTGEERLDRWKSHIADKKADVRSKKMNKRAPKSQFKKWLEPGRRNETKAFLGIVQQDGESDSAYVARVKAAIKAVEDGDPYQRDVAQVARKANQREEYEATRTQAPSAPAPSGDAQQDMQAVSSRAERQRSMEDQMSERGAERSEAEQRIAEPTGENLFADMSMDPLQTATPDRMQRKEQARISNRELVAGTERAPDPGEFVEGYDLGNAEKAGLVPDRTGHWPSRIPEGKEKGLILKSQDHETFYLTVEGEKAEGMEWYYAPKTGRWYTFPKGKPPSGRVTAKMGVVTEENMSSFGLKRRPDLIKREPRAGVDYRQPGRKKGTPPDRPASGKQQVEPAWLKKQREEELAREMERLGGYGSPAVDEATGEQQGRRRRPGDRRRSRN